MKLPKYNITPDLTKTNVKMKDGGGAFKYTPPTKSSPSFNVGQALNMGGTILNGIGELANNFKQAEGLKDTSSLESRISNRGQGLGEFNNFDSLLQTWSADNPLKYASLSDIRDSDATGKGILNGVLSGANSGSSFGPVGSLVGGVVGGLTGLFGGISGKNKAQKKLNDLNEKIAKANKLVQDNFLNDIDNIDETNDNRLASNFYATGGYVPSSTLKNYIKSKEAFVPYVYDDRGGAKRRWNPNNKVASNSVATIGYGFTNKDLIDSYIKSGREMSREEADKRLEHELNIRIQEVSSLPNFHKLAPHQQDAIMALDYAVGIGNVKKFKPLIQALKDNDTEGIANALYTYKLGTADSRTGKGINKAWKSLGNMVKYGEYRNPYTGEVIDNKYIPYRDFAQDSHQHMLNQKVDKIIEEKAKEEQDLASKRLGVFNQDLSSIVNSINFNSPLESVFSEGGYTEFNEGGSHEENPNNGIQFGINPETNIPLKAEEGEVKEGDYIFSNRIKPDVAILKSLGLPQNKNLSYADIARNLRKKLDKRPNDDIMKKYYNDAIERLKQAQESTKRLREKAKENMANIEAQNLNLVPENEEDTLEQSEELFAEGGNIFIGDNIRNPTKLNKLNSQIFRKNYLKNQRFLVDIKDKEGRIKKSIGFKIPSGLNNEDFLKVLSYISSSEDAEKLMGDYIHGTSHYNLKNGIVDEILGRKLQKGNSLLKTDKTISENENTPIKSYVLNPEDYYKYYPKNNNTPDSTTTNTSRGISTNITPPVTITASKRNRNLPSNSLPSINPINLLQPSNPKGLEETNLALNKPSATTNSNIPNSEKSNIFSNFDVANLRYAPIVNAGINTLTDLFGITNYDDFSSINALEDEYRDTYRRVAPTLISGSLEYNPFDTDYAINKLQSQGAATRRAIENNSGGNRATATAGLLASDQNLLGAIGDQMIKAKEYNDSQRRQIADFNRQKDMFNAQQIAQNQQINHTIDNARMRGIEHAFALREQEKLQNAQARNINREAFTQILGQLGREEQDRRFVNALSQYNIEKNKIKYNK